MLVVVGVITREEIVASNVFKCGRLMGPEVVTFELCFRREGKNTRLFVCLAFGGLGGSLPLQCSREK